MEYECQTPQYNYYVSQDTKNGIFPSLLRQNYVQKLSGNGQKRQIHVKEKTSVLLRTEGKFRKFVTFS